MRQIRSLALAATAAVVVSGLAACGGATDGTTDGTARKAADGTAAPLVGVADAIGRSVQKTGGYSSARIKGSIVLSDADTSVNMEGRLGWKPLAMDISVSMPALQEQLGSATVREMLIGSDIYMNAGEKLAAHAGGKHWVKMDLTALGSAGQSMSQLLDQAGSRDPATQLRLLTSSKDVQRFGADTVDGVAATHYHGTVSMAELAAKEGGALAKLYESAQQQGVTTEIVDLWVGADDLPVRVVTQAETAQGLVTSTFDYSDFSASAPALTPPPAADTADLPGGPGSAGGTGGSA